MAILCLHGSFGSAKNFQTQLQPFVAAASASASSPTQTQFRWIDGGHEATPPPGFDTYFGPGPLYRFTAYDGLREHDKLVSKLREFPDGISPEDTMRRLVADLEGGAQQSVQACLDRLIETLDADPDITGVLGYSEGATIAASLVLEEKRRFDEAGRRRHLKSAVFFAGWPPVRIQDGLVRYLLADECQDVIDVPSCHVVGCNDPYIDGAMALFGMCDRDTAVLFDHGKGHTIPRDARTLQELVAAVEKVWAA
ncbi:uncharacterized protein UV8b_03386 [Ustilaginoidea virens]|uniref:Serine hydrolase domain-containing protein n=1 Tax=Ustilaginoidea virens TaxID=1159556 RepID=A0A8E5HP97_USTVR|nr:uncharacterized protein UV8b_03386 [Ustilaginoidea virens]QUC19145.1 hypothetical protein UV8b_03386 [Ustilaginoidea virens]